MIAFRLLFIAALFSAPLAGPAYCAPPAPSLAGTWSLIPERSTDLSPWETLELTIAVDGPHIVLRYKFAAGNRSTSTVTDLDLTKKINVVPVPWWTDNRHIGAYIGGDRTEHVTARWVDGGRILRTEADLVLDTQQGSRTVNILTDYKISPSGTRLTVMQLRSTRDLPIVYVCERVAPIAP